MLNTEVLLSKLDKLRRSGDDSWMALCPAHVDKSPSLSIRDTGDKVLIHCFAGCPAENVLDALGMGWGDLYDDPYKASFAATCAYKGRKYKPVKPIDMMEHERTIIRIGREDLEAGKTLSFEDRARLELAIERVGA